MQKLSSKLKVLAPMLSLMGLILCWPNIAESALKEIEYTETGYLLSEQAGRDILEGWLSDRAAKEQYKTALDSMYTEWQHAKLSLETQISVIRAAHINEREERQRVLLKSRSPGFGVFVGAGYGSAGETQAVIGVGLVWKVF